MVIRKIDKKKMVSLMLILMIFTSFFGGNTAKAADTTTVKALTSLYSMGYTWEAKMWTDIKATVDGQIVYCLNSSRTGPGSGHEYTQNGEVSDGVYTILVNGYPSKSPQELGLRDEKEAYFATQAAVWGFVNTAAYRNGFNSTIPNMEKVVKDLIAKAQNPTPPTQVYIAVNPGVTTATVVNGMYKTEAYTVESNGIDTTYSVELKNAPSGATVVDVNGQEKATFDVNDKFYVVFPKDVPSGQFQVSVTAKAGQMAGLFLEAEDQSIQNVAMLDVKKVDVVKDSLIVNWNSTSSLEILKKGSNGNLLAGATFEVRNSANDVVATVTSDENGIAMVNNLPIGDYQVSEIQAPEGFLPQAESYNVTIKTGETAHLEVVNEQIVGAIKITKTGSDGKLLPNVEFTVFKDDVEVAKGVTNESGILTINNLPYGKGYYVVETRGVDGYIQNTDKFPFEINAETASFPNGEVTINVINKTMSGSLVITKEDIADGNVKIPGAEFTIYDKDGKEVVKGKTDKNGEATFPNLNYGSYTYKETLAPEGYLINEEVFSFEIKQDGQVIKQTVTDKKVTGGIIISKADIADGNVKIPGAEFTIYDKDGKEVVKGKTDKNGEATFPNLNYGSYTYKETLAPEGYLINEEVFSFEIKQDGQVIKQTVTDKKVTGTLVISKADIANGNVKIPGAEFTIYDKDGKEVVKGKTDKNGEATFPNLNYGSYTYKETLAPEGYLINEEVFSFEVKQNGQVIKQTVTDKKVTGTLVISKADIANGNVKIPGAEFTIYDKDGKEVVKGKTDKNGEATFPNLNYGSYTYKETLAPEGYLINEEVFSFEIKQDGQVIKHTVTDKKVTGTLVISKADIADGNVKIPGAEFTIYDKDGKEVVKGMTDKNGEATFPNLNYGSYTYKETLAPEGYLINEEVFSFEIKQNGQVIKQTVTDKKIPSQVVAPKDGMTPLPPVPVKPNHSKGTTLPQTGLDNNGTLDKIIAGVLIILMGALIMVGRKRKKRVG